MATVNLYILVILVLGVTPGGECRSANENAKGDINTFYTSSTYEFKTWLQMLSRSDVIFSVKACSDVHLLLRFHKDEEKMAATEVVLSGWYNSQSAIRNGSMDNNEHYVTVATPGLLHCAEYRTFYISWRHERLRIGRGPNPGEQTIIDMDRSESGGFYHSIRYVGFSTGFGFTGVWQLMENQGYHLYVHVPDDYGYNYLWKGVTQKSFHFVRFRVKACHDVHVNLSPEIGKIHYEVVIGGWGNTKAVIRLGNEHKAEYSENGMVGCNLYRFFWISWYNGYISVGKGDIFNENRFLNWFDPAFLNINYASMSAGYGSIGEFIFEEDLENRFALLSTPKDDTRPNYDMFVETPRLEWMTFQVRICSDAYLGISMSPGSVDEMSQHVYIGGKDNTVSGVYSGRSTVPLVQVDTPDILSCNDTREFWMSWIGNRVKLGVGLVWEYGQFLEFDLPEYFKRVACIGLANTIGEQALWAVRRDAGDDIFLRTQALLDYNHLWITTFLDYYTTFKLRACRDAHILLTSADGVTNREVFEVVLGYNGYKTIVRETMGGEVTVAERDTPDVVSCTDFRTFWIGWVDGYLKVGRGHKVSHREILSVGTPIPMRINALSIATDGIRGSWQFQSDRGDLVEMMTVDSTVTKKWVHVYPWTSWLYFSVSGSAAALVLSEKYREASRSYTLYIGTDSNTRVSLYKDGQELTSAAVPDVMDLLDLRDFYISWAGGNFQFGLGKYRDTEILLEYTDPDPYTIGGVAFMSAENSVVEWRVWEYLASEVSYDTSIYNSFTQVWMSVRHRSHIIFGLDTCGRAEILLSTALYNEAQEYSYIIVMQDSNGMTSIWEGKKNRKYVEKSTPGLLSCGSEQFYWLSWFDGHVVLGSGHRHGQNIIVSHQEQNGLDIRAVSFATGNATGTWRVPFSSYASFQEIPPAPLALSGGEIAGVVIGAIALIAIFALGILVVLSPPERLRPFLTGEAATSGTNSQSEAPSTSFANPLAEVDLVEAAK